MDARVTAYIAAAAPFARPILEHVRQAVHQAIPGVTETMKWGMPFFTIDGRPLAMMAAFKAHAGVGIFDGTPTGSGDGMGNLGKLTGVTDLPSEAVLAERLRAASLRIAAGADGMKRKPAAPRPAPVLPNDLDAALDAVPAARAAFDGFPPGARRDYVDWVVEAKQPATRARRVAATVEWSALGRRRNWKYEAC